MWNGLGERARRDASGDTSGAPAPEREPKAWPNWVTPGWYVAELSSALAAGQLKRLTVANRGLVLARTRNGRAVILDRYCAHQGASLADGRVVAERIECPFHHFRYDATGACVEIPGCSKVPPNARVESHAVEERFGFIWIFVGNRTAATSHPLPTDLGLSGGIPHRLARTRRMGTVSATPRDIVENVVDQSHFTFVHGVRERPRELAIRFEPEHFRAEWTVKLLGRELLGQTLLRPPAFWLTSLRGFSRLGAPFESAAWLFATQPQGPEATACFAATFVQGQRARFGGRALDRLVESLFAYGFKQDIRIWTDKVVREQPLLCANDSGPIVPFRNWWREHAERVSRC